LVVVVVVVVVRYRWNWPCDPVLADEEEVHDAGADGFVDVV
jgi:hypothetical protein